MIYILFLNIIFTLSYIVYRAIDLRGCFVCMCNIYLINVQHSKNYFSREKTPSAVVQVKQPSFHTINRKALGVQHCFSFFDNNNMRKVLFV